MARRQEKQPWGKFFWSDWLSDPKLKLCSLAAQGLWMRMLCIAAEAKPVGYVLIEGNPLGATELAAECGKSVAEVARLLDELRKWGVFSTDRRGRIYSRRMISDLKKARIARENGKFGGNPALCKGGGNSSSDKGSVKAQKPEARSQNQKRTPKPPGGASKISVWNGPTQVREIVLGELGAKTDGYLSRFTWRELPERALVTDSPTMLDKLKGCKADLEAIGWSLVLEKGRASA